MNPKRLMGLWAKQSLWTIHQDHELFVLIQTIFLKNIQQDHMRMTPYESKFLSSKSPPFFGFPD